jgi:hypothetical protein
MNTYTIIAVWIVGHAATYLLGYLHGRETNKSRERAWADGYAAGLAKGDQMWPAVNRWEMR